MVQFGLRSLLLIVALAAVIAALSGYYLFRPELITKITTRAQWETAIKRDRCIVFIYGDWNTDMVGFQVTFAKFAGHRQDHAGTRLLTMTVGPANMSNDVWEICEELWHNNNITSGGLKHLNGAGRVLWIENGKVVDYAWCQEIMSTSDLENFDAITQRTRKAFK